MKKRNLQTAFPLQMSFTRKTFSPYIFFLFLIFRHHTQEKKNTIFLSSRVKARRAAAAENEENCEMMKKIRNCEGRVDRGTIIS